MNKVIFPLLTKEESDYVCQTPWTKEIGKKMTYFVRTKLTIQLRCNYIFTNNITNCFDLTF